VHKLCFVGGPRHVCMAPACPYGDHRGVSFVSYETVVADGIEDSLKPMDVNMHAVVSREVKPRTQAAGCSYALMLNPGGLKITSFITHTWEEPFGQFIGTLKMALNPDDVVWVCSFALNQNGDIKNMLDSDDLLKSPFAKALRCAPKLVVTLDGECKVPERSWCAFEIERASRWSIPTFFWPYHLADLTKMQERVEVLDIRRASASDQADQERIHLSIQQGVGYDAMNYRLRAFMGDRLRFYQAAVERHEEQLKKLSSQMAEANMNNDKVQLEALESKRLFELRMVQAEMEKQHTANIRDEFEQDREELAMLKSMADSMRTAEQKAQEANEERDEALHALGELMHQVQQAKEQAADAIRERDELKEFLEHERHIREEMEAQRLAETPRPPPAPSRCVTPAPVVVRYMAPIAVDTRIAVVNRAGALTPLPRQTISVQHYVHRTSLGDRIQSNVTIIPF